MCIIYIYIYLYIQYDMICQCIHMHMYVNLGIFISTYDIYCISVVSDFLAPCPNLWLSQWFSLHEK